MNAPSAKARLREKGFICGPFVEAGAPELIEIAGLAGFDFAIIDREHAAFSGETVGNLIRAAARADIAPIVRVRENSPGPILEALDLGAVGLHIPQIANAEDARRAVAAAKFPPEGERGFNPFVQAAAYGATPIDEFRVRSNDDTLLVLHIEARDSVDRIDEILAVPGIDVAFLGPYDLSQTLGIPGQVTHPRVRDAMRAVVEAARKCNLAVGSFANSREHAELWIAAGVSYLSYSVDSVIYLDACRRARAMLESLRPADR
jgi:4-hydroxy-2-oxoheptanedioate aldolase